jgi:hypothetical protein
MERFNRNVKNEWNIMKNVLKNREVGMGRFNRGLKND